MKLARIERLTLSPQLSIDPSQACTRRIGILGGTGSGKTYFASLLAEQLYLAGAPFLVIDPVGNWGYGLRLAADGKNPGLPIPVLGGDHGDIGFDPSQGATVGEYLRERDATAVLDVSDLPGTKLHTFVADLFEALYRVSRKRRTPYMVILEEGQTFIPQNIGRGEERMFGAVRRWGRLSRNYGGGLIIVTQRPQSVSKEVFNQIELMMVGNLRGPHERKAVREWVKEQGADEVEAMLKELPKLKQGEFFCWSPEWLEKFERIRVGKKQTYDGSSTPVLGKAAEGRTLAPIDLGELGLLMTASADEDAPAAGKVSKLVRSQQTEMTRKLAEQLAQAERERLGEKAALTGVVHDIGEASLLLMRAAEILTKSVRSPAFDVIREQPGVERAIEANVSTALEAHADALGDLVENVDQALTSVIESRPSAYTGADSHPYVATSLATAKAEIAHVVNPPKQPGIKIAVHFDPKEPSDKAIATPEYMGALLGVIAQHGPLNRHKLSILSGKSSSSSTFASALRLLGAGGLIVDDRANRLIRITATGKAQANPPKMPTGRALYDYWRGRLKEYDRKIFETIAIGPKAGLTRQEIATRTGQSSSSSTFADAFRTLRALGLVVERSRRWQLDETVRAACGF